MPHKVTISPPNPSGLCMCGCGEPAPIAPKSSTRLGVVQGHPQRFIHNHHLRLIEPRVGYIVDSTTGCWEWQGSKYLGYGRLGRKGRMKQAHRYYWEKVHGPVPNGLVLDHLCRNPSCVNPDHLEPVTSAENSRRGQGAKLTVRDVQIIRESYPQKTMTELAILYSVSDSCISEILRYERWHDVAIVEVTRPTSSQIASKAAQNRKSTKLSMVKAREIRCLYPEFTQRAIAKKYGVAQGVVWSIISGRSWRESGEVMPLMMDTSEDH